MGEVTLVLGGTRSGKSLVAEGVTEAFSKTLYVATGFDRGDDGFEQRIDRHRSRRGARFDLLELPDPALIVDAIGASPLPILLDSLGSLIARLLEGYSDQEITTIILSLLDELIERSAPSVVVGEEVGLSVHPPSAIGRRFVDLVGEANQRLGIVAAEVLFVVAGVPIPIGTYRR
ncbi:MAG: bifunctional adenosylcobinamide kinase/adenosylcobinamide-phosphate guanylyltransferase [Ferrimicrobium sp.]